MHLFLIHLYADCFIRSFSSLTSRSSFFLHSLILIINDDACLTSKQLNSLATCIIIIKTTASAYMDTQYTHTYIGREEESVHNWLFLIVLNSIQKLLPLVLLLLMLLLSSSIFMLTTVLQMSRERDARRCFSFFFKINECKGNCSSSEAAKVKQVHFSLRIKNSYTLSQCTLYIQTDCAYAHARTRTLQCVWYLFSAFFLLFVFIYVCAMPYFYGCAVHIQQHFWHIEFHSFFHGKYERCWICDVAEAAVKSKVRRNGLTDWLCARARCSAKNCESTAESRKTCIPKKNFNRTTSEVFF